MKISYKEKDSGQGQHPLSHRDREPRDMMQREEQIFSVTFLTEIHNLNPITRKKKSDITQVRVIRQNK